MLRRPLLGIALKFGDLLIMSLAFLTATAEFARGVPLSEVLAMRVRIANVLIFFLLLVSWHLVFRTSGMYRSGRLSSRWAEVARAVQATTIGVLAVGNVAMLCSIRLVTPSFLVLFWIVACSGTVLDRLLLRALLAKARRQGRNLRNVLIVGTNERAAEFAKKLDLRPELGYRVIGFADDEWSGLEEFRRSGRKVVTSLCEMLEFLRRNVIDEVLVALPLGSGYVRCSRIVSLCEEQGITVRLLSDIFPLRLARAAVDVVDDEPVFIFRSGTMEGWTAVVKRLVDLVLSAVLLILASPLFLVAALAVKLTSPGPALYLQERMGLNKRRFHLHKFRTMVVDAEAQRALLAARNEVSGPVFKMRDDPRLTPVGKLLRKTSIDELPQLWDVLLGNMSLVGPRPLPLDDVQGFEQDWHRRRFSVRPGITCLWQVAGRSAIPFERWMELDMEYIDRWSLWLDLKILLRTIPAVVKGSGAA